MGYYDVEKNCDSYIEMADGFDGADLIEQLAELIKPNARVLEIGMGPGVDYAMLSENFDVVGSDASQVWIDRAKSEFPDGDFRTLDALTLDVGDDRFDAIYSNKVLQHIYADEMKLSFQRQLEILNPGAIALHTLWWGTGTDEAHGMLFRYYNEAELCDQVPDGFEILSSDRYGEMEEDDSICLVLRRS